MDFATFISRAIVQSIPLLYGCTGETISEKSGSLNLGIPGVMYVGGICGVIGSFIYEQSTDGDLNPFLAIMIPLLACLIGSLLMGLLFSFLTITLRANQNVVGLAMTTFGVGFGNFFGGSLIKLTNSDVPSLALSRTSHCFAKQLPFADNLGWFGKIFFSYGFLAYAGIAIAIIASFVLKRTRVGLHLRAIGENPATADAAGIAITKYKYWYMASEHSDLRFDAVRRTVHPVSVRAIRRQHGCKGTVQDASLCCHDHSPHHHRNEKQERESAARKPGTAILPGRAITALKPHKMITKRGQLPSNHNCPST